MKTIKYFLFCLAMVSCTVGCEKDFEEINTNEIDPTSVDPVSLFNNAIIGTSFATGQLKYDAAIVQQIVTPNSGLLTGGNHNQDNRFASSEVWDDYYETVIKHTGVLINELENRPEYSNLYNMTRIIQAFSFMVLTDSYGEIPYFEAGAGFSSQILLPKYDPQSEIYIDLIQQVQDAVSKLSFDGENVTGEVLYSGNISQWKKLGNSLLLRLGMHVSKADNALAKQTVQSAYQVRVMESNDGNYGIRHANNFGNPSGHFVNGCDANTLYLGDTFVLFLNDADDPTLDAIAFRYMGAKSGTEDRPENATIQPVDQIGMA